MLGFEVLQLRHQTVEFLVADLGLVEYVVEVFVTANSIAEGIDSFLGVFAGGWHANDYIRRKMQRGAAAALPLAFFAKPVPNLNPAVSEEGPK